MPLTRAFEDWRNAGKTYSHRGHTIFFRDERQGPALVALHGFPSASWDWHRIWPELTARFRVIAADFMGYGWSDKPRDYRYSLVDQADVIQGLLESLGVTQAHVLAHDYGVSVACELLARHAAREPGAIAVRSVCFLNGGVFPEAHRPILVQRVLASPLGPWLAPLSSKRLFARGLTAVFGAQTPPSTDVIDELWALMQHQDGRLVLPKLLGYIAERRVHRARWVEPVLQAEVPIRLIDGTLDPVSGHSLVSRYRELVRAPDIVELANVGHYPQLEDPASVIHAFLSFHERLQAP